VSLPPFQLFLEEHKDHVYRLLCALVGADAAEDCFQETFLAALRAYPRLDPGSNLRGWVLTIARRKAIDHHRASSRNGVPTEAIEVAAPLSSQTDGAVWEAVRRLPEKQRAAIAYRYVSDLPYRDIARLLGTSEVAARQNVHAALRRLRMEPLT
jgi:RNA polymerase sigma factor (sigma-70 family)